MSLSSSSGPDQLCPALRLLLQAELAAGNTIAECGEGLYGQGTILVLLASPFRVAVTALPADVELRSINDPHWWQAEYFHTPTKHCVACRC